MTMRLRLSRRRFLQWMAGAAGALVVGVGELSAQDAGLPLALLGDDFTRLGPFVRIEVDGRVIIGARDPDCGEGTRTSLPRIIADEMDADWQRVEVLGLGPEVLRDNDTSRWRYGHQRSGDATSIPAAWADLRQAGALARWLLLQTAARRSGVAVNRLRSGNSRIRSPDGRNYNYGELTADAANQVPPQAPPPLKTPDRYRLIGQAAGDVDARAIVTGQTRYAIDHTFADALVAVMVHCPWSGGRLHTIDTADALKLDGVKKILTLQPEPGQPLGQTPLSASVAVLATSTWAALQGRDKLKLEWKPGTRPATDSAKLERQARDKLNDDSPATTQVRADGDFDKANKHAAHRVDAVYTQPFVAHACAEPINALVRIDARSATLIVPTQAPQAALALVQRLTGLAPAQIDLNVPRVGGGLGRRLDHDWLAEAIMLAKAANKPIKLVWTRADDLAHDIYRPSAVHQLSAALDRRGHVTGWRQRRASASALNGRAVPGAALWTSEVEHDALPAGLVENYISEWFSLDTNLARGSMRGDAYVTNAFAEQSFIDEIAKAIKQDPLQVRLQLLGKPRVLPFRGQNAGLDTGRLINVLKLAATRIDWDKPRHNGHGLGIACHFSYGGYCAHAFEVSVVKGKLKIHRALCAIDVGRVINPKGLEAQAMGGTVFGIETALGQTITVKDGQVQQHDFKQYPLAHMLQLPRTIEVFSVASDAPPGGASPVAVPSAAPALANAVFAATTVRIRRLPLLPELMRLL